MTISIAGRPIGAEHRPFVIAEMSGKPQSVARPCAGDRGCGRGRPSRCNQAPDVYGRYHHHARRVPDRSTISSLWNGKELHLVFTARHTRPGNGQADSWTGRASAGYFFSSRSTRIVAVDFLESLQAPAYKIVSFETEHWPSYRTRGPNGQAGNLEHRSNRRGTHPLARTNRSFARSRGSQGIASF